MKTLPMFGLGLALLPLLAGRAAPEPARPADAFVNSAGVNVKLGYTDTPYGDFDKVEAALKRTGLRHVRDGLPGDPQMQQRLLKLHADGIGATLIAGGDALRPGAGPQTEFNARLGAVAPAAEMLEGPNEADSGFAFDGKQFPESLTEFQRLLYRTVKSGPYAALPVIAPSISFPPNSAKVPDLPGDFGNVHSYHGARPPGTDAPNLDLPRFYLANSALVSPGKPVVCTETGNPTAAYPDPSLWMPRISESAQGKYTLRTYLEYFRVGLVRTFVHELVDEHPDPRRDEQNFGLFRHDWSPKPAATGLGNLLAILNDPGRPPFRPGSLDYALAGDTARVHHLLLQKSDGTFFLVLWQEVPSYDPETFQDVGVPDAAVTLTVPPSVAEVQTYLPLAWPTVCASRRNTGPVALRVPDQPLVLELFPRGADLVITSAGPAGPPRAGQPVRLRATVKNVGTAPTPPDRTLSVTFFDKTGGQPKMLTYSSTFSASLAPGQSATLVTDGTWTPTAGAHTLEALADDVDRIPETDKDNNALTFACPVP